MHRLLIATNNPGKMREIRSLLQMPGLELVTPEEIGLELNVPETGKDYAENAAIKGKAFASASGMHTLADDSGLEVEALGGLPGLHSARFINRPGATDAERRQRLLENLKGHTRPWEARFRCAAALVTPQGEVELFEGTCAGEIIPQERGQDGFGYDPVFLIPELGKTMAELSMAEKNQISHRARAIQAAQPAIEKHLAKS